KPRVIRLLCHGKRRSEPDLRRLVDYFAPEIEWLIVRQIDFQSNQFPGLHLPSRKNKASTFAQTGDRCSSAIEHTLPTSGKIHYYTRLSSSFVMHRTYPLETSLRSGWLPHIMETEVWCSECPASRIAVDKLS